MDRIPGPGHLIGACMHHHLNCIFICFSPEKQASVETLSIEYSYNIGVFTAAFENSCMLLSVK